MKTQRAIEWLGGKEIYSQKERERERKFDSLNIMIPYFVEDTCMTESRFNNNSVVDFINILCKF